MSKSNYLSTQPYKGTQDYFGDEMKIRRYIFDTWRRVCESFGYQEYQTPLLEDAAIYRAKSGDEIGGKELFALTDMAERELAIRPEMTPSVTRMIAKEYASLPKPIRVFNISNFMRQERPQRGRNREFWQLNYDIFGEDSLQADLEVLQVSLQIMLAFNPPTGSFTLKINDRRLINAFIESFSGLSESKRGDFARLLDKYTKIETDKYNQILKKDFGLNDDDIEKVHLWMSQDIKGLTNDFEWLEKNPGYQNVVILLSELQQLGYSVDLVSFDNSLIRGFDYYDGMIFEVFDNHPENNRSMFGGGRYNGLAELFGSQNFPAVGAAPGDETIALFLKTWGIEIPNKIQNSVFVSAAFSSNEMDDNSYIENQSEIESKIYLVASYLRSNKIPAVLNFEGSTVATIMFKANQKNIPWVLFIGLSELKTGTFALKNMETGEQTNCESLDNVVEMIQSKS